MRVSFRADVATVLAHTTRGEALHDNLGVNVDKKSGGQGTAQLGKLGVKRTSLSGSARETIENEAPFRVRYAKTLGHKPNDDVVGDEVARIHEGLRLFAKFGSGFHGSTKHVASGDMGRAEFLDELGSLRAFTSARSTQQHDIHD